MNLSDTAAASYLFVPASRPELLVKARRSGADELIVDLEDAVATTDKARARESLAGMQNGGSFLVRINALGTPEHAGDVAAVAALHSVLAVVLPKVESAADVAAVASGLPNGMAIIALIESARGIVGAESIAQSGVTRIMFGSADYLADIGARVSKEILAYPRSRLVVASRAARLPGPVDGPSLVTKELDTVRAEAEDAKALGMGAKLCIHPAQVAVVARVFRVSDEELLWARSVLAAARAHYGGVFAFEGSMVDEAVLIRARQLVGNEPK